MRQTIEEQIVMENSKLQKLEREAHQWVQQALPNLEKVDNICPQMQRLLVKFWKLVRFWFHPI